MKHLATISVADDGKAVTVKKVFSRETAVRLPIKADQSIVWALLTNVSDFHRWNSTVISLEGELRSGGQLKLKSILDEKRVFNLKVKALEPESYMVWGDSMGNRVYTITPSEGNNVTFTMAEKIGGPLFPLFARYIPPFDEIFAQFAADLKQEAETIYNAQN
jgi:uncharacterized protein YndB with AHSA1/START domain